MAKYEPKTHLVRTPTLVIGVGGIGGQIVRIIDKSLTDYDRGCVKLLVMDTDSNDIDKSKDAAIPYIQTSENQSVSAYLEAHPEFLEWFPTEPLINGKNLIEGAGQIRSVSRLGALASKAIGRFDGIRLAIDEILRNHGDSLDRAVRIMIVGSVTGGTGSGLGIQLPFYIRKVLKEAEIPDALIRGLFLMPCLTEPVQDTIGKKEAVNVNGYAFLKELNAFYRMQRTQEKDNLLRIEEYTPGLFTSQGKEGKAAMAAMVPYDFLYLVEKQSGKGNLGDKIDTYIERSAQIVLNQLFSPLSRKFSAEDNLIVDLIPGGGMNRYCGAGVSMAVYPKDDVVRYCTLRYAGEMIGDFWMQIDEEFKRKDQQQSRLRKTNPNLLPLDRGDMYCKIYDDMCNPQKTDVVSDTASLKRELFVKVLDEDNEEVEVNVADMLTTHIEEHIQKVYNDTKLPSMAFECRMTATAASRPKKVANNANECFKRLRNFKSSSEKVVSDLTVATAEEIFPSVLATAQNTSKDAEYNIYIALQNRHPIIARYLLYKLRAALTEEKQLADAYLNSEVAHYTIFNEDYFPEGEGDQVKETPAEAVLKINAGWLSAFGVYSALYKKTVKKIVKDVAAEAQRYTEIAQNTLRSIVYRIVLDRIDMMIELYENFFDELGNIMEQKKKEAAHLESGRGEGQNETFAGDRYICSNAACKQYLYAQFCGTITDTEKEMSDDVKKGFFDKMYGEYEARMTKKANPKAVVAQLSYDKLFEEGVLEPVVAQFADKSFKHLDMGILDAMLLQYKIEKNDPDAKEDCDGFKDYFRSVCTSLMALAAPYMLYKQQVPNFIADRDINYAWGLNYQAAAEYQTGSVDGTVDAAKLAGLFAAGQAAPLVDDSFSPYQLVCYSAVYALFVENCVKYYKGTRAEQCYRNRLKSYVLHEYELGKDADAWLSVIHPHLNRLWHEHAYLPELMGFDDKEMCKDIRLAFLLAMALTRCTYESDPNEGLQCWCYRESAKRTGKERQIPIVVEGEELSAQSAYMLYRAFDYNRVMVEDMLQYAEDVKQESYTAGSFAGITADAVLGQTIIKGMLGDEKKANILDVLYDLYRSCADINEVHTLVTILEDYLEGYCLKMMNGNANKAAAVFKKVLSEIGNASKVKGVTDAPFFKEAIGNFLA